MHKMTTFFKKKADMTSQQHRQTQTATKMVNTHRFQRMEHHCLYF